MQIINDLAALEHACAQSQDPNLAVLLRSRASQLLEDTEGEYDLADLARWIIIEIGDHLGEVEAAIGYQAITFELVTDHGGWIEGIIIISDDGFGVILLVPDVEGIDSTLLSKLREQAVHPLTTS